MVSIVTPAGPVLIRSSHLLLNDSRTLKQSVGTKRKTTIPIYDFELYLAETEYVFLDYIVNLNVDNENQIFHCLLNDVICNRSVYLI